jgi:chromosome segregation ATPase
MKYLKKYNLFIESDNFDIQDTDKEDVKMSKQNLNDLKKKLSEYNSKKSAIDSLYKSKSEIKKEDLEKIIGKEEDKNDFLVSYANISSIKKKIDDLREKENKKALELSEFKDRLTDASDIIKPSILKRIEDIQVQKSGIKSKIEEYSKNLPQLEKEHIQKMSKIEDDMKNWIEKIQ